MTYIKGNPRNAKNSALHAKNSEGGSVDSLRSQSANTPTGFDSTQTNNPRARRQARHAGARNVDSAPQTVIPLVSAADISAQPARPAAGSARAVREAQALSDVRSRRKHKRAFKVALCVILVLVLCAGGAAAAYLYNINKNLQSGVDSSLLGILTPTDSAQDPFYMLLMGVDGSADRVAEYGEDFRSDSIMLVRVDPQSNQATLVSIPRDTQIELGEYGTQKINAAHFFGGAALSVETVSELAGVPISHYAEINFDGFKAVIDALGGVEVDVPMEIDDAEAGGHLDAGVQTLSGEQALILCRSRHAYDDYGNGDEYRAANQRVVLSAIAQKILSSDVATLTQTLTALSQYVTTDLSVTDIVAIATSMVGLSTDSIYTGAAPVESEYVNNIWYDILQVDEWKEMMARVDSGLPPTEEDVIDSATGVIMSTAGQGAVANSLTNLHAANRQTTISLRNGNGTDGVCTQAEKLLEAAGYSEFNSKNADSFDYASTIVVYTEDSAAADAQIIAQVLGVTAAIQDETTYLFDTDVLVVIGANWSQSESAE
jgi:LCP family protein required for cell wall assembly